MVKSNYERKANDDYFTIDQMAIDGLWYYLGDKLKSNTHKFDVWEPACGGGHISKYLENKGLTVKSTDLNYYGFGEGGRDFLKEEFHYKAKHIITNPPYVGNLTDEFATRAIQYVEKTGGYAAFLMRQEWDCAHKRNQFVNESSCFATKIILQKRPYWFAKEDSTSSPRHNYAWFVWHGELKEDPMSGAQVRYYHPDMEQSPEAQA